MIWTYNDGGRAAAGYRGEAGDCVCRAISIACDLPYKAVYEALNAFIVTCPIRPYWKGRKLIAHHSSVNYGVNNWHTTRFLKACRWNWHEEHVHLKADELPGGRIIVRCPGHLTAMIDGVIHDTHNPSQKGKRAVYGYFSAS